MYYQQRLLFIKKTSLNDFYSTGKGACSRNCIPPNSLQEREVSLILTLSYRDNKLFADIKCPINPLPVKGEFRTPSRKAIIDFLISNGWDFKMNIPNK